jgi:hypothetical protein
MFLHVGKGKSIKKKDIIGIFDLDTATVSRHTKHLINRMTKEGRVTYMDTDLPRSFVLCADQDGEHVELSRISSSGLYARLTEGYDIAKE